MATPQQDVEIWRNTTAGMRYFKSLDHLGRETYTLVQGGARSPCCRSSGS